jgi:hypothetical protein
MMAIVLRDRFAVRTQNTNSLRSDRSMHFFIIIIIIFFLCFRGATAHTCSHNFYSPFCNPKSCKTMPNHIQISSSEYQETSQVFTLYFAQIYRLRSKTSSGSGFASPTPAVQRRSESEKMRDKLPVTIDALPCSAG